MTTLTHPSEQFPDTPAVAVTVPRGWEQLSTPGTLLSAVQRVPAEQDFSSNVVVRGGTRRSEDQVMDFLMELNRTLQGLDELVVGDPMTLEVNGIPFTMIEVRFKDGRGTPIRQLHAVTLRNRGEVADFVQVTASCGGPAVDTGFERIDAVVRSVLLGSAATAAEGGEGLLTHPSPQHPGAPTVSIEVPDGWTSTAVPMVALATVKPVEGAAVTSNAIIRTSTVPASTTPATLVEELRGSVVGRLDGAVSELGTLDANGTELTLVQLAWTEFEGPAIAQLHAMALLERPDGLRDYVNVTGTAAKDDAAAYAEVEQVVRSVRVTR